MLDEAHLPEFTPYIITSFYTWPHMNYSFSMKLWTWPDLTCTVYQALPAYPPFACGIGRGLQANCACVHVCVFAKFGENYETTKLRLLLKPFGYRVMTIYITHGCCFQTWEDSRVYLHISKHNCYCIMTIASKALHETSAVGTGPSPGLVAK